MKRDRRGSALVMTLFLVFLAALAMSRFIEKAYAEILGEALYVERDRLRLEAYSALETTVAVLYDMTRVEGALRAPEQGWGDPFAYAGVELPEGVSVEVNFIDEMGKISLPQAGRDRLLRLFEVLGFAAIESQDLADALLEWITPAAAESVTTTLREYERAEIPYRPPQRPLRSFYELAAIAGFREAFFDAQGVPNSRFYELTRLVSLYRFPQVNVNSASPAVIGIWADIGEREAIQLSQEPDRERGQRGFFEDLAEASAHFGMPLPAALFNVATTCLRAQIVVSEGGSSYVLTTVIAPAGASANLVPPSPRQPSTPATPPDRRGRRQQGRPIRPGTQQEQAVGYPFVFLEIRENDAIL